MESYLSAMQQSCTHSQALAVEGKHRAGGKRDQYKLACRLTRAGRALWC